MRHSKNRFPWRFLCLFVGVPIFWGLVGTLALGVSLGLGLCLFSAVVAPLLAFPWALVRLNVKKLPWNSDAELAKLYLKKLGDVPGFKIEMRLRKSPSKLPESFWWSDLEFFGTSKTKKIYWVVNDAWRQMPLEDRMKEFEEVWVQWTQMGSAMRQARGVGIRLWAAWIWPVDALLNVVQVFLSIYTGKKLILGALVIPPCVTLLNWAFPGFQISKEMSLHMTLKSRHQSIVLEWPDSWHSMIWGPWTSLQQDRCHPFLQVVAPRNPRL